MGTNTRHGGTIKIKTQDNLMVEYKINQEGLPRKARDRQNETQNEESQDKETQNEGPGADEAKCATLKTPSSREETWSQDKGRQHDNEDEIVVNK
jgi:hypothetical protein